MNSSKRIIHRDDALAWLAKRNPECAEASFITSLPDCSEFPALSLEEWKSWFVEAAALVLSSTPDHGVAIFYQSDIKHEGIWVDKAYLIQKAAERTGHPLLWHTIVCRKPAGTITFGRPAYSHLLCFSKGVKFDVAKSTASVLPDAGETTWARGMGTNACLAACRFVLEQTTTRTVIDPFCGHGTVLAVANFLELRAVGVELGEKRAGKARKLLFTAQKGLHYPSQGSSSSDGS